MTTLNELVTDFLAQKRIAVAGVSRTENDVRFDSETIYDPLSP